MLYQCYQYTNFLTLQFGKIYQGEYKKVDFKINQKILFMIVNWCMITLKLFERNLSHNQLIYNNYDQSIFSILEIS